MFGVVIHEIRSTSEETGTNDYIVLKNLTGSAIDVSNFYIADGSNLTKYQIPAGTTVPANGYAKFSGRSNPDTAVNAQLNFNLSFGERVRLVRPDGTTIVQRADVGYTSGNQVQRRGDDGKWRIDDN
jgi:hypothetical protein